MPLEVRNYGLDILRSPISPSYEVGYMFSRTIKKNWGVGGGITFSDVTFRYNFNFYFESTIPEWSQLEGTLFRGNDVNKNFSYRSSFPLFTYKQISIKDKLFLKIQIGMQFDWMQFLPFESDFTATIGTDGFNNQELLLNTRILNEFNYLIVSYFAKVGIIKYTKNNNFIGLNFVANHSPEVIGYGKYEFHNLNNPSKGFLFWRASYFGLELSYGLRTKRKKDKNAMIESN